VVAGHHPDLGEDPVEPLLRFPAVAPDVDGVLHNLNADTAAVTSTPSSCSVATAT
jgi:hypothetical protein